MGCVFVCVGFVMSCMAQMLFATHVFVENQCERTWEMNVVSQFPQIELYHIFTGRDFIDENTTKHAKQYSQWCFMRLLLYSNTARRGVDVHALDSGESTVCFFGISNAFFEHLHVKNAILYPKIHRAYSTLTA